MPLGENHATTAKLEVFIPGNDIDVDHLLLEVSDSILLESGDNILLEKG